MKNHYIAIETKIGTVHAIVNDADGLYVTSHPLHASEGVVTVRNVEYYVSIHLKLNPDTNKFAGYVREKETTKFIYKSNSDWEKKTAVYVSRKGSNKHDDVSISAYRTIYDALIEGVNAYVDANKGAITFELKIKDQEIKLKKATELADAVKVAEEELRRMKEELEAARWACTAAGINWKTAE